MKNPLYLQDYATFIFDCDGVVLDSNKIKTEAFYKVTLPYGEAAANAMIDYHVANGGVSRYKKFDYFVEKILPSYPEIKKPLQKDLLENYANHVAEGLFSCDLASNLAKLRQVTCDSRWLIVSGGDQAELRDVFARRGIAEMFDGGIFGSPDAKKEILGREISSGNVLLPALFLGDSKYDYQVATLAGLDFLFISGWSEVEGWYTWARNNNITNVPYVGSLLEFNTGNYS